MDIVLGQIQDQDLSCCWETPLTHKLLKTLWGRGMRYEVYFSNWAQLEIRRSHVTEISCNSSRWTAGGPSETILNEQAWMELNN